MRAMSDNIIKEIIVKEDVVSHMKSMSSMLDETRVELTQKINKRGHSLEVVTIRKDVIKESIYKMRRYMMRRLRR